MAFLNDVKELKARLHILHDHDDENLERLIEEGHAEIQGYCGKFDLETNTTGRKLVYEYVRFAYNGMTEHFYTSFLPDLIRFGFELWDGDEDVEETRNNSPSL